LAYETRELKNRFKKVGVLVARSNLCGSIRLSVAALSEDQSEETCLRPVVFLGFWYQKEHAGRSFVIAVAVSMTIVVVAESQNYSSIVHAYGLEKNKVITW